MYIGKIKCTSTNTNITRYGYDSKQTNLHTPNKFSNIHFYDYRFMNEQINKSLLITEEKIKLSSSVVPKYKNTHQS